MWTCIVSSHFLLGVGVPKIFGPWVPNGLAMPLATAVNHTRSTCAGSAALLWSCPHWTGASQASVACVGFKQNRQEPEKRPALCAEKGTKQLSALERARCS